MLNSTSPVSAEKDTFWGILEKLFFLQYNETIRFLRYEAIVPEMRFTMQGNTNTQYFKIQNDANMVVKDTIDSVYMALTEKGYNPVSQIVGYIMSGDPTYITNHNGARSQVMRVERDEIIEELLREYIRTHFENGQN